MNNKGFTLIELLVVVGIIGILASIAIPSYNDYKSNAYHAVAKQQVIDARTAIAAYLVDEDAEDLHLVFNESGNVTSSTGHVASNLPGFVHTNGVVVNLFTFFGSTSNRTEYTIVALHCNGPDVTSGSAAMEKLALRFDSSNNRSLQGDPSSFGFSEYTSFCN